MPKNNGEETFSERKDGRIREKNAPAWSGMFIDNCVLSQASVWVKKDTGEGECTESTNGSAIQVDPKRDVCLNQGCDYYKSCERG
jgi:hypothetical protein